MNDDKKSAAESLKTFKVMPNSGHHYFFIPLTQDFIAKHGGPRGKLVKDCRNDRSPWQECYMAGEDKPCRWMRYRLGNQGDRSKIGIWIALESNFGTIKRGTVMSKREVTAPPSDGQKDVSPYRYESEDGLKKDPSGSDRFDLRLPAEGDDDAVLSIEVVWVQAPSAPIDVDIVVDFGNTRTVVLALENNRTVNDGRLSAICRNIRFLPRGQEYPLPDELAANASSKSKEVIADSWFLLQEPQFSEWDYPSHQDAKTPFFTTKDFTFKRIQKEEKAGWGRTNTTEVTKWYCTERVPQMFVEISPVLMGEDAKELFHLIDLTPGLNISMSSPKRYLWDREAFGEQGGQLLWNINENPWTQFAPKNRQNLLHGQICRYMYADGRPWDIDTPPYEDKDPLLRPHCFPEKPAYPRCCAMVWTALFIIENAYRQITSASWRTGNNEYVNRRLRNIHVTFPSGWIAKEKQYYREAWQQAVNIFTLAHMESREPVGQSKGCDGRPDLCVKLDEAVASQLPFVYSEIRRLHQANLWIQLYGRRDDSKRCTPDTEYQRWRTRIMTVDIGGGTTDSTVVEYRNDVPGSGVSLRYKVLFKDCSSFAGDAVTKSVIERVLLPSLLEQKGIDMDSDEADILERAVKGPHTTQAEKASWQRVTSLFFLPIVRQWLGDAVTFQNTGGVFREEDGTPFRTIRDCGVEEQVIEEFNRLLKGMPNALASEEDRLRYDPNLINDCIREELSIGLEPLGKFVAAYDVDVVTLSGKISEMPIVFDLLCEYLPIRPQRIVRMKNFLAGDWYPMSYDGRHIDDAKTVTSVGASLFAASESGLLGSSWTIIADRKTSEPIRNFWGEMKDKGRGFSTVLLTNQEDSNESKTVELSDGTTLPGQKLNIESYIGRQKYYSRYSSPEQEYQLHWTGDPSDKPMAPLAVTIRRCLNDEGDDDIELAEVHITDPMDEHCDLSKVKLILKTLPKDGFWMEEAMFNIDRG